MIDSSVDYKYLPRPTWAEIDIDAVLNNINEYKKALGDKVKIIVAAKGNGYGHGMLPIVKAINELDIYGFATGNMYEAIEMRKHGIDKPIQLFAHNFPETADLLVKYDLMPSFVKPGDAKSFADALGKDVALKVWVKCDTGLGRLGLLPEEVLPELEYIRNTMNNVPQMLLKMLTSISDSPAVIMIMINLFMILLGMLMDDTSGVLLATPILLPIVTELGVSPIQFAAIVGVNLGMGNITPPTAPLLYLGGKISGAEVKEMLPHTMRLILFAWLPTLIITTYVPDLSLFLPRLFGYC